LTLQSPLLSLPWAPATVALLLLFARAMWAWLKLLHYFLCLQHASPTWHGQSARPLQGFPQMPADPSQPALVLTPLPPAAHILGSSCLLYLVFSMAPITFLQTIQFAYLSYLLFIVNFLLFMVSLCCYRNLTKTEAFCFCIVGTQ
jgi:hypothetical protein